MKRPTSKKINKSTLYYLICGGIVVVLVLGLVFLWAYLSGIDILAGLTSKYALFVYGAIVIYLTVGLTLIIKDKIKRM